MNNSAAATFLSADFFTDRRGLRVEDSFKELILPAYPEPLVPRGLEGVIAGPYCPDARSAKTIIREAGGEKEVRMHSFSPDQVADLIAAQATGAEGVLGLLGLNVLHLVGVYGMLFVGQLWWCSSSSEWHVSVWRGSATGEGYWKRSRSIYNTRSFELTFK